MTEYNFLEIEEIIEIHDMEIETAGGAAGIRDRGALEAASAAPKASLEGTYLMGIFEMAASYVQSLSINHPFIDGNKRTAAASALTFLYLNGYETAERHEEEIADLVLDFLAGKITKADITRYFREQSKKI